MTSLNPWSKSQRTANLIKAFEADQVAFNLCLSDGTVITCHKLLRAQLNEYRAVFEGRYQEQNVIIKILFRPLLTGWQARTESRGIELLYSRNILTPKILFKGSTQDGSIQILIIEKILANSVAQTWHTSNTQEQLATLQKILPIIACHHAAGLRQLDLHLGNIIICNDQVYTIDGAKVKKFYFSDKLPLVKKWRKRQELYNLCRVFSRLEDSVQWLMTQSFNSYLSSRGDFIYASDYSLLQQLTARRAAGLIKKRQRKALQKQRTKQEYFSQP